MKRSEYEDKLEEFYRQIEELKYVEIEEEFYRQIEELKNVEIEEDGVWNPNYGDTYWYIDSLGIVKDEIWHKCIGDDFRFDIGNVFKTKEQAEFEVNRLKVIAKLKKFSCKFRKDELNYYISINSNTNELLTTLSDIYMRFDIYFESYEKANEAIEAVGEDRIKKYLFGIEEF